jgi:hypothetical protein
MASFGSKLIRIICIAVLLAAVPVSAMAQDRSRSTFTWSKPADYVVFNSITDNPAVGDEQNFLMVRDISSDTYADQLAVTDGQEIVLRIYYDNDAGSNLNLKATNTRVRVTLPGGGKISTLTGYISADNAKPETVSDTATLTAPTAFSLAYEKGSAQIWNNVLRGSVLPDSIVSQDGAQIGYENLDGVIQGGPQYSGYVTLKALVHMQKTATSRVSTVPNSGPGDVIAIFALATLIGTAAHITLTRRSY